MKRVGHLMEQIVSRENLLSAYAKAARGKAMNEDRIRYAENLEDNIQALAVRSGEYNLSRG